MFFDQHEGEKFFTNLKIGPTSPEEDVTMFDFMGKLSFWWLDTFIFTFGGSKREMTYDDIYKRMKMDSTNVHYGNIEKSEKRLLSKKY
jgi:hypothetical protein